jgi:glycosyltransferase involved in cell wall biosynthesis
MKISVLMSVYYHDDPAHFGRALKSIWTDQTRKPDEIVLVEDGPLNPKLAAEIDTFRNTTGANVRSVKLRENGGLTCALNKGLPECSGDLIARMDADDISAPDRFELQHDFFVQNPNTDVLGGGLQEFAAANDCRFVRYYPENTEKAKSMIAMASPFAHPSVMFNRRVFDQGYRYNEKYRTSQDIDLWFVLLKNGFKFANIPIILIYFRVNADFANRRSTAKAFNEFKIYWRGVLDIFGWNWRLVFPVFRLVFRLSPKPLVKKLYFSNLRSFLNSK